MKFSSKKKSTSCYCNGSDRLHRASVAQIDPSYSSDGFHLIHGSLSLSPCKSAAKRHLDLFSHFAHGQLAVVTVTVTDHGTPIDVHRDKQHLCYARDAAHGPNK